MRTTGARPQPRHTESDRRLAHRARQDSALSWIAKSGYLIALYALRRQPRRQKNRKMEPERTGSTRSADNRNPDGKDGRGC